MAQPQIIILYCHKGGVSKTTTTFNLGWKLSEMGKKVMLVDADPQCNLTGMMMSFEGLGDMKDFYEKKDNSDIFSDVKDYFLSGSDRVGSLKPTSTKQENLWLIAGNIDLGMAESQIQLGLKTWQGIPRLVTLPGLYPKLIRDLANDRELDYVLVDTAPSLSALNQCLFMGSDHFIIPTSPDYYSAQAIESMVRFLPGWKKDIEPFRNGTAHDEPMGRFKFPSQPPQFLGYIVQNYRIRSGQPGAAFRDWIDKIDNKVRSTFVPAMKEAGLCDSRRHDYRIGMFSDFNSLIAMSQEHGKPIFALTDEEIGSWGAALETQKDSRDKFNKDFGNLAEEVITLTSS